MPLYCDTLTHNPNKLPKLDGSQHDSLTGLTRRGDGLDIGEPESIFKKQSRQNVIQAAQNYIEENPNQISMPTDPERRFHKFGSHSKRLEEEQIDQQLAASQRSPLFEKQMKEQNTANLLYEADHKGQLIKISPVKPFSAPDDKEEEWSYGGYSGDEADWEQRQLQQLLNREAGGQRDLESNQAQPSDNTLDLA